MAITCERHSESFAIFHHSSTRIVGLNPSPSKDVCFCHLVLMYCPVRKRALRQADPPSKLSNEMPVKVVSKIGKREAVELLRRCWGYFPPILASLKLMKHARGHGAVSLAVARRSCGASELWRSW